MKYLATFAVVLLGVSLSSVALSETPKFSFTTSSSSDAKVQVVFTDSADELDGKLAQLNQASNGRIAELIALNNFAANDEETLHLQMVAGVQDLLIIGTKQESEQAAADIQDLGGTIAKALHSTSKQASVSVVVDNITSQVNEVSAHLAYGFHLRDYAFDTYKNTKRAAASEVEFVSQAAQVSEDKYNQDLKFLAEGVHLARDLASEPGKSIYPQSFVNRVRDMFDDVDDVKIRVLDRGDMEKRNMGALLGVGKGSIHEPRLLIIEYMAGNKGDAPIALAGKGITFDTGGISLKRNDGMWAMKSDLSGAAAVAGTMYALASRKEQANVVGLMPLAENMPAEDAIRPGDVLETMQGTTIEIISTDAEGRLILADAVFYAQQEYKPKMLLNIATLTGSAGRALSDEYAALITRDFDLSLQMMEVGKRSGEHVWPLPLHPNHFKQIVSDIADIKNSGAGSPGASIGAAVIGTFVTEDLPWVHLDIAGVDWLQSDLPTVPKGAQGWGVRFMDQLVRENK